MEESFKSRLVDCLSQQISEIELLFCMYPNKEDIILTDSKVLKSMKEFIDNLTQCTPHHLDLTLNLHIDGLKLEISINLPSFYPDEEPDIYVRCNQLNRQQESALNLELSNYVKENHNGEQCLYNVISWIQDNIGKHSTKEVVPNNSLKEKNDKPPEKFVRLWIYSHHIYNKKKRDEIVRLAKEFNLTGFCAPGKPGIICIEGPDCDCNKWWKIIKVMNWKKIVIRKTETFDMGLSTEGQRFKTFREIHFVNQSLKNSKHSDMSELLKYIENFGLSHVFNEFFGLCNSND